MEKVRLRDLVDGASIRRRMTVKTPEGVNLNVTVTGEGGIEIKATFTHMATGEYRPEYLYELHEPLVEFLNKEAEGVIDLCLASAKASIDAALADI